MKDSSKSANSLRIIVIISFQFYSGTLQERLVCCNTTTIFMLFLHLLLFLQQFSINLIAFAQTGAQQCKRNWKKVGCFHDYVKIRPLIYELVNRRDPYNHHFDGIMINWKDYPGTLHSYVQIVSLFIEHMLHLCIMGIFMRCNV